MITLPIRIYVDKKAAQLRRRIYIILALICIWGFWYGTGKFLTAEFYYPNLVILSPISFCVILYYIIKESRICNNNEPLILITDKGIQFYEKKFKEIGIVNWTHITGCIEINDNDDKFLNITVENPAIYTRKTSNNSDRKKIEEYC